jgi:hypothetical protein
VNAGVQGVAPYCNRHACYQIGVEEIDGIGLMPGIVEYFRDLAHRCTRLARRCSDIGIAHELEGIGAELMERAHEIERSNRSAP